MLKAILMLLLGWPLLLPAQTPVTTWVTQQAQTPQWQFVVEVASQPTPWGSEAYYGRSLLVQNRNSHAEHQRLLDLDQSDDYSGPPDTLLTLMDVDFDGHEDILLPGASGGAGPNNTTQVYRYQPQQQRFVRDALLSELPQLQIDAQRRQIYSFFRNGCCSHAQETYRYIGGKATLIASLDKSLTSDGKWLEITRGKLVNGKMRYRVWRQKPPADD